MRPIFITGIGTGVGKTLIAAIVTEALAAHYWKPVQAGLDQTDSETIASLTTHRGRIFEEAYRLQMPASPHIAAREEGIIIEQSKLLQRFEEIGHQCGDKDVVVIEGAGGLMVPLTEETFVSDMPLWFNAPTILVSRNYLGSINHSLLTAAMCRQKNIHVLGWLFNDQYLQYESEIEAWTQFTALGSIPFCAEPTAAWVSEMAAICRPKLMAVLNARYA